MGGWDGPGGGVVNERIASLLLLLVHWVSVEESGEGL